MTVLLHILIALAVLITPGGFLFAMGAAGWKARKPIYNTYLSFCHKLGTAVHDHADLSHLEKDAINVAVFVVAFVLLQMAVC